MATGISDKVVILGKETVVAKSTGKTWESDWAHVMTFKDGKCIRFIFGLYI